MAIEQPIATDYLSSPDHSLLHRIIAADLSAAVKSITVDASSVVKLGSDVTNYIKITNIGVLTMEGSATIDGIGAGNLLDKTAAETITANWTLERLATHAIFHCISYSTASTHSGLLDFKKSHRTTVGFAATVNNERLLNISAGGTNSGNDGWGSAAQILVEQDGNAGATYVPGRIVFSTATAAANVAERMRIDSAGNFGFGVSSLESWYTDYTVLQIGATGNLMGVTAGDEINLTENAYRDNVGWKGQATDAYGASLYSMSKGIHMFLVTSSVTADAAISWTTAMEILNDGGIKMENLKSGTDQANAGAAEDELYVDTNDDNTVKRGT